MRTLMKILVGGLASLAMVTANAEAGIVMVQVDRAGTGPFDGGGFTVDRNLTKIFGTGTNTDNGDAGFTITGTGAFNVTYSFTGGQSFGSFFDAGKGGDAPFITMNPNNAATFDGFLFEFSSTGSGSVTVGSNQQDFIAGNSSFEFRDFAGNPGVNTISFTIANDSGTFTFGSMQAVPEPSAFLLVASALGLTYLRRRR